MRSWKLNRRLKAAFERHDGVDAQHAEHLEQQLRARYRSQYSHGRLQMLLTPRTILGRTLLGATLVLALAVVACEVPTSHTLEMGKQIHIAYEPTTAKPGALDPQELVATLSNVADIENVNVNVMNGSTVLDIVAWGQDLDSASLTDLIRDQVGPDARVEVESLTGTVRETMRERLGRAVFHFDVEGQDAEEIRAQILAQLAEQGFGDDSSVQVDVQDGVTTISIEAQKPAENGGTEATQEIIIEQKKQN